MERRLAQTGYSDTVLGRDMNTRWENIEQPASNGKQQMVVRQVEPPRAQNMPTQRQVYTIDDDEAPATPARQRGPGGLITTVERASTPQTGAQLVTSEGTATLRDPSIAATRVISETAHEATVASATPQLAATGSGTAPATSLNATWTAVAGRQWG